jgi:hypothetical protein
LVAIGVMKMPLEVVISLCASPTDFWMSSMPSAPPAAGLLTTMIGCLVNWCFWMMPWIVRAIWSDAPPAENGTTISTGLFGSQAAAGPMPAARIAVVASQYCFMIAPSR